MTFPILADRVRESSTTSGTGNLFLAGAETGYHTFIESIGANVTTFYTIVEEGTGAWETGYGFVITGSPPALVRVGVYDGSNNTAFVNFTTAAKTIFISLPATKAVVYNTNTNVLRVSGSLAVTGSLVVSGTTSLTASLASTASLAFTSISSSAALFAISSSRAVTSSFALLSPVATSASFASFATSASWAPTSAGAADWNTLLNRPSGIISSSAQVNTILDADSVVSSSAQVVQRLAGQNIAPAAVSSSGVHVANGPLRVSGSGYLTLTSGSVIGFMRANGADNSVRVGAESFHVVNIDIAGFSRYQYGNTEFIPTDTNIALGSPTNPWSTITGNTISGSQLVVSGTSLVPFEVIGVSSLRTALESVFITGSAASGSINIDILRGGVTYFTGSATANFRLNFRGNATTTLNSVLQAGQSCTTVFLAQNGATGFYPSGATAHSIDGTTTPIRWQGSTPIEGNSGSIDAYTYTIIKTGNALFTVLGSQTKFG